MNEMLQDAWGPSEALGDMVWLASYMDNITIARLAPGVCQRVVEICAEHRLPRRVGMREEELPGDVHALNASPRESKVVSTATATTATAVVVIDVSSHGIHTTLSVPCVSSHTPERYKRKLEERVSIADNAVQADELSSTEHSSFQELSVASLLSVEDLESLSGSSVYTLSSDESD